jgi:hypothetical protein
MKPMTKLARDRKSAIMKRMLQVNPDAEPESTLSPHMAHCAHTMIGSRKSASQARKVR